MRSHSISYCPHAINQARSRWMGGSDIANAGSCVRMKSVEDERCLAWAAELTPTQGPHTAQKDPTTQHISRRQYTQSDSGNVCHPLLLAFDGYLLVAIRHPSTYGQAGDSGKSEELPTSDHHQIVRSKRADLQHGSCCRGPNCVTSPPTRYRVCFSLSHGCPCWTSLAQAQTYQ